MIKLPKTARRPLALAGLVVCGLAPLANASSHREAPFITEHPKVDGTDFYMFRSYESGRSGFVTVIANYLPLQDAYGGPNYFTLDSDALYEIMFDTDGDAVEDITYQFRFRSTNADLKLPVGDKSVSVPVINIGPITAGDSSALNVSEQYTLTQVRGQRRGANRRPVAIAGSNATVFTKPVDNIGTKSLPDYASYANQYVYDVDLPGCATPGRVFVGQRKDSFAVNLGEIFDLVNITAPATEFDPGAEDKGLDTLAYKNVTTLALELPVACVTGGSEPVIGAWTTASLRRDRLLKPAADIGALGKPARADGPWQQVSRLGMPLVNEVVIGLKDKNRFNASLPANDGQFIDYVTNPTLPAVLEILFGGVGVAAPTNFPRTDLVTAFLTGVQGLNQPGNVTPSEMLRLNTGIAAAAPEDQDRLGVIAGDNAGFPNGRRPGDDVVDIALRVVMGKLCTLNIGCAPSDAPAGGINFTDGALQNAMQFDAEFPYLTTPLPGASH